MAGVYPLSRMQQLDPLSLRPLSAGRLFIFQAGTSTPFSAFKDYGLTNPHASPILLDSAGRVPMVYLADGTYRHRLESSSGTAQFDDDGIPTTGPSGGGGGGGTVFDANALFQIGDPLWIPVPATISRIGWVRMNAKTIGNGSSGATERANSDTQFLYIFLWTNYSDTVCPVAGGRGLSGAADFAAGKTIGLPDMRGKGPAGVSDMGNTDLGTFANVTFATGSGTSAAATGGEAVHTLSATELPVITPVAHLNNPSANLTNPTPALTAVNGTVAGTYTGISGTTGFNTQGGGNTVIATISQSAQAIASPSFTFSSGTVTLTGGSVSLSGGSVTVDQIGSGGVHNNMAPFRLGTWFQKL